MKYALILKANCTEGAFFTGKINKRKYTNPLFQTRFVSDEIVFFFIKDRILLKTQLQLIILMFIILLIQYKFYSCPTK